MRARASALGLRASGLEITPPTSMHRGQLQRTVEAIQSLVGYGGLQFSLMCGESVVCVCVHWYLACQGLLYCTALLAMYS